MTGSALDPAATRATGDGVDRVDVYLGDATISGTAWPLTFTPDLYPWGSVSLYAYARSRFTGQESYGVHFFRIV